MTEEFKDKEETASEEKATKQEESVAEEDSVTRETQISELEQQIEDLTDQNLRLQAEIQNMHKRNQRDREQATKYRSQDLGRSILPVIDNLERALTIEPSDESAESLHDGIKMVLSSFETALKDVGIEKMDCLGKPFDPNFHEAYTQVPAEEGQESGLVVEIFESGYMLHDRILRAAKVAVSI